MIDDSPEDRAEIRRLLLQGSERRYQFIEAETGADGVRQALAAAPDCMVLDYFLPDMDAPRVLAELAGGDGAIICPVVVLTGSDRSDLGRVAMRAGAQDFLGKSWMGAESLTRAIENAAEKWAIARERRASEEMHRLFFENAAVGMVCLDPATGRFLRANRRYCEMTGYSAEELSGMTLADLTVAEDRDRDRDLEALGRLRTGELARYAHELRYVRKDGTILWIHADAALLRDAGGRSEQTIAAVLDITARKQAEAAVRESEHFLQRVTDVTPGVLHVFDLESRSSIYINRSVASMIGYGTEEVAAMGDNVAPLLVHPDDLARFPAHLERARALRDDETASHEYRMRDRTGEWHWFHSRDAIFSRDDTGAARQLIGTAIEITALKQAEEALRTSEAFNRTVLESSPDCVKVLDAEGRLQFMNVHGQYLMEIEDFAPFCGQAWWELWPETSEAVLRDAVARASRGETVHFQASAPTVTGTPKWWDVMVAPAPRERGDDRAPRLIAVSRDVSAQKRSDQKMRESEERARLATEATAVGIWQWDVSTGRIQWDAQMFRHYGIAPTPDGFVRYTDWSGAVLPEDLPATERVLQDTVRRLGNGRREFRIRRRSDGEIRHIEGVETVRPNAQGEAEWVVGTNSDVTDRKDAERTLRKLAADLSESDRRKDEFLATLAHELRNPLAPIRTGLDLMRMSPSGTPAIERARAMMDRQLGHMVRLVDDLMDVSRISRGQVELKVARVQARAILDHAVEASRSFIEAEGHALVVSAVPESAWVDGDLTRLSQMVGNLLNNAAKYTPEGGRIELHARVETSALVLTVTDNGAGISSEMLPNVFDLFSQVDRTLDRAQGGLGIGLSVVRKLVWLHGGTVSAESPGIGLGSTFTVRLPLAASAAAAAVATARSPSRLPDRLRVLVVDDNVDASELLSEALELAGHDARAVHDGVAAFAAARAVRPDVVFLDIGMPGMDGHEVARGFRAEATFAGIVLVALTGWSTDADRRKSREAGFDHHLTKPVELARVLELLAGISPPTQG